MVSTGLSPEQAQLCDWGCTETTELAGACSQQRLSRHFQPTARDKTLAWESAAGGALCTPLHTISALEENLCPFHREPVSLSGDQAQADTMGPGARFRDTDPWVYACWRSSQVLPVALQLAENTLWGEHETAPVMMTVHTGGTRF